MSGATIFVIILILLLLAAATTFLILWLVKRNEKTDTAKELAITGTRFNLTNNTTVVATWDSVGSPDDSVILYADTNVIDLDANGVPEPAKTPKVLKSDKVAGSAKTTSISNLMPFQTYYLALVVTNSKFSGHNSDTGTVYTGSVPAGTFSIREINSTGGISSVYPTTQSDIVSVEYDTKINKTNINDVWNYDATNFTLTQQGPGANTGTYALYNNSDNVLAARKLSSLQKDTNAANSYQWVYSSGGDNKWCLKSNPKLCMSLDTPVTNTEKITLSQTSKTQWKNILFVFNS